MEEFEEWSLNLKNSIFLWKSPVAVVAPALKESVGQWLHPRPPRKRTRIIWQEKAMFKAMLNDLTASHCNTICFVS